MSKARDLADIISGAGSTIPASYLVNAGGGGIEWQPEIIGAGMSSVAEAGKGYLIDTSTMGHYLYLPASPSLGDEVAVADHTGNFDTNNLTIGRNFENIQGLAEDLTVSVDRSAFTLVYSGLTNGWILKDK
jgi:hypothetical protein